MPKNAYDPRPPKHGSAGYPANPEKALGARDLR